MVRYVSLPCTYHRLRTTDSGHGAATWLFFCTLIRIPAMVHRSDGGVVSQALMAMDLKQHGGDTVILNNSAGAVAENRENFSRKDVIRHLHN